MQSQMKQQKQNPSWQDLNPFILSTIFAFLGVHDRLFGPPYVCHSWLSATLHTLFHNSTLDLRFIDDLDQENQRFRYTHLLKLAINHYQGWVSIHFPTKHLFGYFATLYIAERTPRISCVALSSQVCVDVIPVFVSALYWRNLRVFRARVSPDVAFLLISQLADHCKNITELRLHSTLMEREVLCIVGGLPQLELLNLSESTLSANALEIVLDGRLKRLKEINVLHSQFIGDDGIDIRRDYLKLKAFKDKMLEKASGLRSLKKLTHCLVKTQYLVRSSVGDLWLADHLSSTLSTPLASSQLCRRKSLLRRRRNLLRFLIRTLSEPAIICRMASSTIIRFFR